jgi:telomerase reverse transcriptase
VSGPRTIIRLWLKRGINKSDVEQFISNRKHESLSLHYVIQGFRTSDCEWLASPGKASQNYRTPVSDANKRRELLEDFLFWYFDGFVLPLLKAR